MKRKPFTLIAAIIFGLMAIVHLYRLFINDFTVEVAGRTFGQTISWIALIVTGLLSVMLFRESSR